MDSIALIQEVLKIVAFLEWLAALVVFAYLAIRQILSLRNGKLLRVKRLLLLVSVGLVLLGILPLVARLLLLLDHSLDPTFQSVTSFFVASALLVAALSFLAIFWLDPSDPRNNE